MPRAVSLFAFVLLAAPCAAAEEPAPAGPGPVAPAEKPADRIAAALDEATRLEFPNTPLRDALAFLADYHNVNIIPDEQVLTAAGISIDDPVDIILSGITLRSGLDIILEPLNMTYTTTNEVLVVTTAERAARTVDTRGYDISAFVDGEDDAGAIAGTVTRLLEPRSAESAALVGSEESAPAPPEPNIVPFRKRLLVTATWADHKRIDEILRTMREGE